MIHAEKGGGACVLNTICLMTSYQIDNGNGDVASLGYHFCQRCTCLRSLVYNQLYEYLNTNGLLISCQSGFRACYSAATALFKCNDDWLNSSDARNFKGVVFVDLKKASDTVDHDILLHKLALYDIQGDALAWFHSYPSNSSHFTRMNGYDSNVQSIRLGVPLGSCLGPLLFPFISMTSHMP